MITNIKLYKIKPEEVLFGKKRFIRKDITDQLEMPIYDTAQLDAVLDTSQISLLTKFKTPLKPFTRIIIELTDETNGETTKESIYRYVDNDAVQNVGRGNVPIYRHTVSLIEITKILERRVVDNLSFTNFLPHNYGVAKHEVDFNYEKEMNVVCYNAYYDANTQSYTYDNYIPIGFYRHEYASDKRFMGPNVLLDSDTGKYEISTAVYLKVEGKFRTGDVLSGILNWLGLDWANMTEDVPLKEYYVIEPDGNKVSLSTSGTYTFSKAGYHTFTQVYRLDIQGTLTAPGGTLFKYTASWKMLAIQNEAHAKHEYTIKEVVNRLLSVGQTRASGLDEPEFVLDANIAYYLQNTPSPEFSLTQCSLFEALTQIGKYIHGVPRLIPQVVDGQETDKDGKLIDVKDDWSNWNVITFDLLGQKESAFAGVFYEKNNKFIGSNYSLIDLENPSEEYASDFISHIQNATVTNYDNGFTLIEPYEDGFLSTRTESAIFEISDNECIFKTREPIRAIKKVELRVNGDNSNILDITGRVVEKAVYNLKSEYDKSDYSNMKTHYLYYEEGQTNIRGLTLESKSASFVGDLAIQQALITIIQWSGLPNFKGNLKDIEVRIKYIPFVNFKARQYKTLIKKDAEKSTLFYNQQSNELDVNRYGEAMNAALLKTGNIKLSRTQYFNSLSEAPKCGQWHTKDYYAFQVSRELSYNAPIKATTTWSRHYNELFADVEIQRAVRQFEISEKESIKRNVDIEEFCIVDTRLDVDKIYSSNDYAEYQSVVEEELKHVSFATVSTLAAISAKLANNTGYDHSLMSCAICSTESADKEGNSIHHDFVLPVCCFSFGRAIVCQFKMDDNYSAATYAVNASAYGGVDSYALEQYIEYGNEYGRFSNIIFELADTVSIYENGSKVNGKQLYKIDLSKQSVVSDNCFGSFTGDGYGYIIDKDSREQLSVTAQLNFVTANPKIEIFKGFIESIPFASNNSNTYRYVVFTKKQNKFDEYYSGSVIEHVMPTISYSTKTRHIRINSVTAKKNGSTSGGGAVPFIVETPTGLTIGEGYGIIDNNNRLCLYIEKKVHDGETLPPIYLMFRRRF